MATCKKVHAATRKQANDDTWYTRSLKMTNMITIVVAITLTDFPRNFH